MQKSYWNKLPYEPTAENPPPPQALVWLYCRSLFQIFPHTAPFIIMVVACRQSLHNGKEPHIQVNSQPERFLDYSLFIPVIPPAVVWSLWKMCVWVRGARANELRASLLIVSRLGAVLHPSQKAHSNHQQPSISGRCELVMLMWRYWLSCLCWYQHPKCSQLKAVKGEAWLFSTFFFLSMHFMCSTKLTENSS